MIDGVKIVALKTHEDNRGFFREIFRFSEQFKDLPVGQLSHSLVKEGTLKAWHGHVDQSQWNYVVFGKIKVVLYDNRKESFTYKEVMEFVVGDIDKSVAYFFPPGVLHSYKCYKGPMHIIYVTSGIYDLNDEVRISKDDPRIRYIWNA